MFPWHCLAHSMNIEVRNDRLVKRANKIFEKYYKSNPTKGYGGFDVDELENIESHFKVCINQFKMCRNRTAFNSKYLNRTLTGIIFHL